MRHRTTILVVALILVAATFAGAQDRRPSSEPNEGLQQSARSALATFSKLVDENNFRAMGFDKPDDVAAAGLGDPIREYMIGLEQVQRYQEGSDPTGIVSGGTQFTYPVTVRSRTQSSISLTGEDEKWQAIGYGGASMITLLDSWRAHIMEVDQLQPAEIFVLRVPALNLHFLAHYSSSRLMVTPVLDFKEFDFTAGETMSAERMLLVIQPVALKHDGSPG